MYMAARQWSLEQMESQVGQVPDILKYARTRKDLTQNHASKHNLYLTIQGGFCITIGWLWAVSWPCRPVQALHSLLCGRSTDG